MAQENKHGKIMQMLLIILNVGLIIGLVIVFLFYDTSYRDNLYAQNVDDITNINQSAANISYSFFSGRETALKGTALYVAENDCTPEETMAYLYTINTDADTYYELIAPNGKGYLIKRDENGIFIPVDYSSGYDGFYLPNAESGLHDGKVQVEFTPEFTDAYTAMKSFALSVALPLREENGDKVTYTLMSVSLTSRFQELINLHSGYDELSTVLITDKGDYIIGNSAFKSTNFFSFLTVFNDYSLDQRTALEKQVAQTGKGVLECGDSRGRDSVFVYAQVPAKTWYCVTAVPVDNFHNRAFDILFTVIIISVLLFLMALDFMYMVRMNRVLRISVKNEKIAGAAKTDFLSRMSHDIRTPMNAIIGYLTIARDTDSSMEKIRHCLNNCEIAAKQLLQLINDILDMSSIERGKLKIASEVFDLKQVILDVTTIFYQTARGKSVNFQTQLESIVPETVTGDQLRLNQVLMNLLSNAVKFTPADGHVTLSVRSLEEVSENDTVRVQFSVSDTGIGMSPEYLSRLFMPFEQESSSTAKKYGGSGLGLSIAHSLVEMMNGTMTVDSVQGKGTTFTVVLPFKKAEQADVHGLETQGRALLADDNAQEAAEIKNVLKMLNVKTDTVSPSDALKRAQGRAGGDYAYTLCILDWDSGKNDILPLISTMKDTLGADCPKMVMMAYDVTENEDEARSAGVDAVMGKPVFVSVASDMLAQLFSVGGKESAAPEKARIDMSGLHVLLAEDNAMNMEIAVTVLEKAGIAVEQAFDGKQAYDRFIAAPAGTYQLILMDIQMPVMNGYEATKQIRASAHPEAKTIPIIAMTANAFTEDVDIALQCGMTAHVSKPINYDKLFAVLKQFDHRA